jgi:hypothetical protein
MFRVVALMMLVGCPQGEEVKPPEPAPAPAPAPAPVPEPPAPAAPESFQVDALNAAVDANVGKTVVLKGINGTMAKVETPPGVALTLFQDDTLSPDHKAVCVMDASKEAEIAALAPKSKVQVTGVVSKDAAGVTTLTGCTFAEKEPPAAPEGGEIEGGGEEPHEGKAGKKGGKAKAH